MKAERHKKIIQLMKSQGVAKVTWLAKQMQVTPETIRADLNELAGKGLIQRCHGGAIMEMSALDAIAQEEIIKCLSHGVLPAEINTDYNVMKKNRVCVLGSFNVDMSSYLDRFPQAGESLLTSQFIFSAGGKGNNQAQAASLAGSQVHFITKVGSDQFSKYAIDFITTSRLQSYTLYQSEKYQTGTAIIMVDQTSGENMIAITPGANMAISEKEIRMVKDQISESSIILIQLETNVEALKEAIKIGQENDIPILLNPAPYNKIVDELVPSISYLTPNQTEASLISGIDITDVESALKAAVIIHDKGVATVVITLGSNGSLAFDGVNSIFTPAFPAVVKNTTGAGDAFNGAFAASLAKGESLKYALCYASAFASLAVETENASQMPEDEAVMNRITQSRCEQRVIKYDS